jgi:DNA-binding LacI/PurR family transcriptional regulator
MKQPTRTRTEPKAAQSKAPKSKIAQTSGQVPRGPATNFTIEDVANAAGVSVATVSRALRDLPNVAPSTRQKVLDVAQELHYVVDPTASRLAAGKTRTVAVAVPVLDAWYCAKVVAGIEAVLKESDFDLLLYAVTDEAERKRFVAGRGAWWRRSDAVILVDICLFEEEASRLAESGAAVVTIGTELAQFSSVRLDEMNSAREATEHLIAGGHRRIALLKGDPLVGQFRVPLYREQGFFEALADAEIEWVPDLQISGGFSIDGGREAMRALLSLDEPPTAVFAMSDEMAFGALHELQRQGLSAPDDVAIVGFDDHDISEIFGLTTIRQDVEAIGAAAARMALSSVRRASDSVLFEPERVVSPTKLIVRKTS